MLAGLALSVLAFDVVLESVVSLPAVLMLPVFLLLFLSFL
jgi:hypothetical protein